ncbi:4-alpha-glucanotransferase [Dysgonomonas sp. ZJ279]|uniref:4-alpha-glucanotransferase n=1 Tax=Dysgonomonas sp. ZJ279 TaxID=2709796 RepID=UPI0013EE0433|nr:4-alpha-glucanotransferase [Dysgonomonas sp. ZJ279]
MKIILSLDYNTVWGQTIYICGSTPELGNWDEGFAKSMTCIAPSKWQIELEVKDISELKYYYIVKESGKTVRREWGNPHTLTLATDKKFIVEDIWQEIPQQKFLYTSCFTNSFFHHNPVSKSKYYNKTILLQIICPYAKKGQELILCGDSKVFGNWQLQDALHFTPLEDGIWLLTINASQIKSTLEYKLAIYDANEKKIVHWENGNNRSINPLSIEDKEDIVNVQTLEYRYGWMNWRAAGVSIPVFSLRSDNSFGIGEFSDIKKLIDWTSKTGQKVIQILPINDTTITYTWTDSYPYNAISIYALHPIYLGLNEYPLKDQKLYNKYQKEAGELNTLANVDYDKVIILKWKYLTDLFAECGNDILKSKEYTEFYKKNEEWLFPYACFSYLRDKHKTANYSLWKANSVYNESKLKKLIDTEDGAKTCIDLLCFTQFLLHKQLVEVKEYAHTNGVILKGDIPIGISRDSVEAWVEPHLFNLDVQTGAPPDDFSVNGQNWGFPTYNWDEMAKDGYQWWIKRFRKMADYFDAYRIDHILGFFRIWEIPLSSVQGLLGYFSPALPLSIDEIHSSGMWFDEYRMTQPYIHDSFLGDFFGEYSQEVIGKYMHPIAWQRFELNEDCNTQVKIKKLFAGKTDEKSLRIRDGLYGLCNEVLFIHDKRDPSKYHPRITAQYTYTYCDLDDNTKAAFNRLYDDFFYHRHSQFWREEAMKKLPTLISSTSMLVCGEDLGMIPACVPSVMHELQILSLEIERMPKEKNLLFERLSNLPYLSVCTTSTHDMAPIRAWWNEDRNTIQQYYNQVLWKVGAAPEDCTTEICKQIVNNHLNSPSMLAILPLQDWLSIDSKLRRENPDDERINIPSIPQHYWCYRMHLTLEDLLKADEFNNQVKTRVESSDRIL